MTSARQSIIVCATPRSGSTFLSEALRLAGVGDPDEWFIPKSLRYTRQQAGLPPEGPIRESIEAVLAQKTAPDGTFAVKIMWQEMEGLLQRAREEEPTFADLPLPDLVATLFPAPRFIHLRREDQLKQAVSYSKAEQSGQWKAGETGESDILAPELTFQFMDIRERHFFLTSLEKSWAQFFAETGFPCLPVTYETTIKESAETIRQICAFLDRPLPSAEALAANSIARQSDGINAEWFARYSRLAAMMEPSPGTPPPPRLAPEDLEATFAASSVCYLAHRDVRWNLPFTLTNSSPQAWPCVGHHTLHHAVVVRAELWSEDRRSCLGEYRVVREDPLLPGKSQNLTLALRTPTEPGVYQLELRVHQIDHQEKEVLRVGPAHPVIMEIIPTFIERQWSAHFPNAQETSWGWRFDPAFGYFNTLQYPWTFHAELGWIYCAGPGGEPHGHWLWDWKLGLLWTSDATFPRLFSFERQTWLEYQRETRHPRVFHQLDTGERIEVDRVD